MQVTPVRLRKLLPPRDSLREALRASRFSPKDGDVVVISSKVVSIDEGATTPMEGKDKNALIFSEADWYKKAPRTSKYRKRFTIAKGALVGSAGIDESNGNGSYILYPSDPFKSARALRAWIQKEYRVRKLALIISDSNSTPLRRGAIGFALAWDGIDPLHDYRGTPDIFGRLMIIEMANIVDGLAAAAVVIMGESAEQTPVAVIRGAKNISFKNRSPKLDQLLVEPGDDIFAPFFWKKPWQKGGAGKKRR